MVIVNQSTYILNSILKSIKEQDIQFQKENKFDFSEGSLEKWKNTVTYAINLLEDKSEYCLIKAYDIPYSLMDDIDLLIENESQLLDIYNQLKNLDFIFKHIPFNDKLKLSAINKKLGIEIDFYPDAKWSELRYLKKSVITNSRIKNSKHGIFAFTPKPEHEIYIVATHSYFHGKVNLLEILNTIKIILEQEPKINEIVTLSKSYHFQNSLLVLLSISNQFLEKYGCKTIPNNNIEELYKISHKRFRAISKKNYLLKDFPIKFSFQDLISSSLSKISDSNLDISISRFDELNSFIKHNRVANFFYSKLSKKYSGGFLPN